MKLFCVCCAAVVLPLAPLAIGTVATSRRQPIPLEGSRIVDRTVVTRDGRVLEAIRFGDAAWVGAASPEARRRFRNVPVGTAVAYRLQSGEVVAGRVTDVAADAATIVRRLVLALLALVGVVTGLALGLAGSNRAAISAGGFLSGLGATLAFGFLEPNLVRIASPVARDAVIVAFALVPAALWCRYLLLLAAELPVALRIRPAERVVIELVTIVAVARAGLLVLSQIGPLFDRLPFAPALAALVEGGLLQNGPYLLTAATAVILIVRQARAKTAERDLRERARIVAWGCVAGIAVPLAGAIVQAASLLFAGRLAMPREAMALLLLPLLLVPASLTYALLARRVERVGVLARRALVFAIAERTLTVLALVPLAILIAVFRDHRAVVVLGSVAAAGLLFAAPLRRALERLFFRDRSGASRLGELARRLATDPGNVETLLTDGVDDALRVESVDLFVADRAAGVLVDVANRLPPLELSSRIAAIREPIDAAMLDGLSDRERAWLRSTRLLVPLHARDGRLLAMLVLGETMSGLPFSDDERTLLAAVAATAALTLESRESPPPPAPPVDPERALICGTCASVFDPMLSVRCAIDDAPLLPAEIPHVLQGKFRFDQRLGAGAMGVVYRARDLALGRDVAIKTLPALSPDDVARIELEARAVAALSHPSIATIHAAESWHGRPMLVFELLERGTLAERIARGPLPPDEVVRIGIAIADATAHAHAAGVLHRDLKPSNIGFHRDGTAKILDFGLAHARGIAGTVRYLSPETILGEAPSPRADVWSLAVTLYEALTGRNPFAAASPTLTMNAILGSPVARPDAPPKLADALVRALERDPAKRIAGAAELRDALE